MAPLRIRILPVLGLIFGAPVCAEYLQVYLPMTGRLLPQLAGLLILGPLYSGAALIIRETAVRTGRGWPGILLLAVAFGVLMPGVVDLSLWREHNPEVTYWDDLRHATLLPSLGFAVYPLISWVAGHVLYSIGAPLALLDALAPRHRRRPLLGRAGIAVVTALCLASAALIHQDARSAGAAPSAVQQAAVAAAAILLAALALSPVGRPVPRRGQRGPETRQEPEVRRGPWASAVGRERAASGGGWWTPLRALVLALVLALAIEVVPWGWAGAGALLVTLAAAAVVVGWLAHARPWDLRHVTALAGGGLVARCLVGLISPLPPGVSLAARSAQSLVLLAAVVAVISLAWRASAPQQARLAHGSR